MLNQQTRSARAPQLPAWLDPRAALRRAYAINRPLTLLGVLMMATLAVSAAGLLLDPRAITGAPAWLKPAKFSISIALYSFTLLWMLSFVEGRPRWVRAISAASLVAFIVEMVAVITQVVRGTTSHFNVGSPLDSALFSLMGTFVMLIWLMNLAAAVLLLRQRLPDPAVAWALRLGLLIALVGGALGALMTQPTAAQLAALRAGQPATVIGAHSVGVADGGPGMPITGWSTVGGDLRIGHFIGLHALQALPIVGWLLTRRRAARRLRPGQRLALVWVAGASYLGLIALVTWQALRGQPLLAPDAATLAAAGAWLAATLLATGAALGLARPRGAAA